MTNSNDIVGELAATLASAGISDSAAEAKRIAARVPADEARRIAQKRVAGVPLAYALGSEVFMGHEFLAEPGVIIPREVSALVVQTALRLLEPAGLDRATRPSERGARIVDMCSGSGNLACALALALPAAQVWSADLMPACSALARRNVDKHALAGRVEVVTGDLFAALAGAGLEGGVDVVTASPPFISSSRLTKDRAFLLDHEPREAFDAGPYGLSIHRRLVKEALPFLRPGGWLVCEVGEGQSGQVRSLFERADAYEGIELAVDSSGVPLTVYGRKRS